VQLSAPGDAMAMRIMTPGGPRALSESDIEVEWELEEIFASLAGLNAVYPASAMYTLEITSGSLAPLSQAFTLGVDEFPGAAPFLTGSAFDDLRTADPSQPIDLTWPTPASAGAQAVFACIFRELGPGLGDEPVFETTSLDPMSTGVTLPAGTLLPGADYTFEIGFANGEFLAPDPQGFDADAIIAYETVTTFPFTARACPPACPGDANDDGVVNFSDITSVLDNWLSTCGQ